MVSHFPRLKHSLTSTVIIYFLPSDVLQPPSVGVCASFSLVLSLLTETHALLGWDQVLHRRVNVSLDFLFSVPFRSNQHDSQPLIIKSSYLWSAFNFNLQFICHSLCPSFHFLCSHLQCLAARCISADSGNYTAPCSHSFTRCARAGCLALWNFTA